MFFILCNCVFADIFGGTDEVKITDGTETATVRDTGTNDSLNVAINDASGNQVTSFGGGTQYTEADTDTSITGTAIMFEVNTGTSALGVASASNPIPVDGSGVTQPISGTVTANAGTNLNTSALCLETSVDQLEGYLYTL